ncbi:Bestrophin [Trichostrongylus colubriformis]|uniref:Bestrophin homolog n=1 Tax=Trichostrongylus colubriformis TaxID=6319 RepID=A0AAN8IPX8_TRICO
MTVSYNLDVSSVSACSFIHLLFRWRGSIWKSVMYELLLWIICYYFVFTTYRVAMTTDQKRIFEKIAAHCDKKLDYIPLTFMLGFFVTIIVDRWKNIFNNMGWIENVALTIATLFRGDTKEIILARRTVIRYLVLSQILVFRDISMRVRRRFPNAESLVTAGFMHEHEKRQLENISIHYNKYWAPINWALTICYKGHAEGHIATAPSLNACLLEIKAFRTNLSLLCNFDWVPVPIAYPQVVFLAVRVYFLICLISRQYIVDDIAGNQSLIDLYVPFMTILQFIFLVGWMKVAEALLNPLGEDDDDFECNFLIDKNIATGLAIVDETYDKCPELMADRFMDPNYTPVYSEESKKFGHDGVLIGSAEGIKLADSEEKVRMVSLKEKENKSGPRSRTTTALRRKLSDAFSRGRARSVQPVQLCAASPNFTSDTQRPYTAFDLSNGYTSSPHLYCGPGALGKLDEETDKDVRAGGSTSTVESIDESEVPELFKKELQGSQKSNQRGVDAPENTH